jgi:hypothetical protein
MRLMAFVLTLMIPAAGFPGNGQASSGWIYLGVDYFTATPASGIHDALYLVPGIVIARRDYHFDLRSSLAVALPDALVGAVRYLSGKDSLPPLWDALNHGDDNIGLLRILESQFRYTVWRAGASKVDLGGLFDVWWMFPWVRGTQFGNIVWNLGPSVGWGYSSGALAANLSVEAGNGFSDTGAFNPFLGAEGTIRVRLHDSFGLYARCRFRRQSYDYSGFSPNDPTVPDDLFDIRRRQNNLSLDVGFLVGFLEGED